MVGFITVNPDTIAFSAHMDWIRRLCGLLQHCIAQQYSFFPHSHTHINTNITYKLKLFPSWRQAVYMHIYVTPNPSSSSPAKCTKANGIDVSRRCGL